MGKTNIIQFPVKINGSDTLIIFDNDDKPTSVSHTDCDTSFVVNGDDVLIGTKPDDSGFMHVNDSMCKKAFIEMCFQFILLNDPYKLDGYNFREEDMGRSK